MTTPHEQTTTLRLQTRAQEVFRVLIDQAPNGMRLIHMRRRLPDMTEKHILEALEYLEHEKKVVVRNNKNNAVPDRIITHYALTDPRPYPIRETITVGEVEFPGMIHGDLAGAEDLNIFSESLAEYDSKMEGRITDLAAAMTRRYWTNIAILFALFVAVFAFILRATDPIVIEGSEDAAKLALTSTARLLPLAGILFGFVLSMWWLVRRL